MAVPTLPHSLLFSDSDLKAGSSAMNRKRLHFPNKFKLYGLRDLTATLVREVSDERAILDEELAVPDHHGRTVFAAQGPRGSILPKRWAALAGTSVMENRDLFLDEWDDLCD